MISSKRFPSKDTSQPLWGLSSMRAARGLLEKWTGSRRVLHLVLSVLRCGLWSVICPWRTAGRRDLCRSGGSIWHGHMHCDGSAMSVLMWGLSYSRASRASDPFRDKIIFANVSPGALIANAVHVGRRCGAYPWRTA